MQLQLTMYLLLVAIPSAALAIDSTDVGNYRIISVKNEPTQKVFRIAGGPGAWRIDDKQPDGTWQDVTCEGGCTLNLTVSIKSWHYTHLFIRLMRNDGCERTV